MYCTLRPAGTAQPMSAAVRDRDVIRALTINDAWNDYLFQASTFHVTVESSDDGGGEPLQNTDGPSKLDQAKEAVQAATQTVKETTQSVADAIEAGRQPGAPLDRLARWAREAPLHAVTVAFLVGVLLGRHRR